jgi:hypothetical protein
MKLVFKANLQCNACVQKISNELNAMNLIWNVDLNSEEKRLSIESESDIEDDIIHLLDTYGFDCELISNPVF